MPLIIAKTDREKMANDERMTNRLKDFNEPLKQRYIFYNRKNTRFPDDPRAGVSRGIVEEQRQRRRTQSLDLRKSNSRGTKAANISTSPIQASSKPRRRVFPFVSSLLCYHEGTSKYKRQ